MLAARALPLGDRVLDIGRAVPRPAARAAIAAPGRWSMSANMKSNSSRAWSESVFTSRPGVPK